MKLASAIAVCILVTGCITSNHFIVEDGTRVLMDPDTKMKRGMIEDSLLGTWKLETIVVFNEGEPSLVDPSKMTSEKDTVWPQRSIEFLPRQKFKALETCQVCPQVNFSGKYQIEIRNFDGLGFFYFVFDDGHSRDSNSILDGHFTDFGDNTLQITGKDGNHWIYRRLLVSE